MRRASAIALTVWISALLMLPVVLAGGEQARLPACCRAAGKHRCGLEHAAAPGSGPAFCAARSTCPLWHVEGTLPAPAAIAAGFAAAAFQAAIQPRGELRARTVSLCNPAFSRSGQKRGPPAFFA